MWYTETGSPSGRKICGGLNCGGYGMAESGKLKKWVSCVILCVLVPTVVIGGTMLFSEKRHAWISLCVAVLACVPFFLYFEWSAKGAERLIPLAILTALSVLGRILLAPIPSFKPVTAMVVLTAMYFGSETGFLCGALSAVISNFYFGQGAWTPFQMFAWGIVGFLAGLLAKPLKKSRIFLGLYGIVAGVLYSFLMDILTVLWMDGYFNFPRYFAALATALPVTVTYAVSNVVFLELFVYPIGSIFGRFKTKYAI